MKFSKPIFLSLIVLLMTALALPTIVTAQDEELPEGFVAWTSEDESYQLAHPEGWVAGVSELDGSITVANSQELYDRLTDDDFENDPLESGDQAVALVLLPAELMTLMGMELDPELPADEFATAMVEVMMGDAEVTEESPTFGEAEILELGEDQTAGAVPITIPDQNIEGWFVVQENEGVIVIAVLAAAIGEGADFEEVGSQIFSTFQTSVTAESLMGELMGESDAEVVPEATEESGE